MIQKAVGYKVGEQFFPTIIEAQKAELATMFKGEDATYDVNKMQIMVPTVLDMIVENADKIVDILTMTPRSKPKARKINGGKKNRTAAVSPNVVPSKAANGPGHC